jgi:hypothetical protein
MGVCLYPSTQRHYRTLILLLVLLYYYIFRSYDYLQARNILLARITYQLTHLVINDDHYNVSDIIKQRIRCQLINPS